MIERNGVNLIDTQGLPDTMTAALFAISIALAAMRIAGVTHEAYQAAAHLFVGYLLGAWWIGRSEALTSHDGEAVFIKFDPRASLHFGLAVALSVVEVVCAVVFRVF